MDGYKLVHFVSSDGQSEFVVILSPNESTDEYLEGGDYEIEDIVDIDGDCTSFPTDRELRS